MGWCDTTGGWKVVEGDDWTGWRYGEIEWTERRGSSASQKSAPAGVARPSAGHLPESADETEGGDAGKAVVSDGSSTEGDDDRIEPVPGVTEEWAEEVSGEVEGQLDREGGSKEDLESGKGAFKLAARRGERGVLELRLNHVENEAGEDENCSRGLEPLVLIYDAKAGLVYSENMGASTLGRANACGAEGFQPNVALLLGGHAEVINLAAVVAALHSLDLNAM